MAKYNDPISGKTVEATNAEEAKKIIEGESQAKVTKPTDTKPKPTNKTKGDS